MPGSSPLLSSPNLGWSSPAEPTPPAPDEGQAPIGADDQVRWESSPAATPPTSPGPGESEERPPSRNRLTVLGLIGLLVLILAGGVLIYLNFDRIRGVGGPDRQLQLIDRMLPDDAAVIGLHWAGQADRPGQGVLTMTAVIDDEAFELTADDYLANVPAGTTTTPFEPAIHGQAARTDLQTGLFLAALNGLQCPMDERDAQLRATPADAQFVLAGCRQPDGLVNWESLAIDGQTYQLPTLDAGVINFMLTLAGALLPDGEMASLNWHPETGGEQQRFDMIGGAASPTTSPKVVIETEPWSSAQDWWRVSETVEASAEVPALPVERWQSSDWSAMLAEGMVELGARELDDIRFHLVPTIEYGPSLVIGRMDNTGPTLIYGADGTRRV